MRTALGASAYTTPQNYVSYFGISYQEKTVSVCWISFVVFANKENNCEVCGFHGGAYEDSCLLIHRPGDGCRKYLRNIGKLLPDYTAQQPT
jgi:hypothetical protein